MGYEIKQIGSVWLVLLGNDQLRKGIVFERYVEALEAVQLLGLEIRLEDKTFSRFKVGA